MPFAALVDEHPHGGFNQWRARENECIEMGTVKAPSDVVVGLLAGRENDADPVEDLLQRDAFQRACGRVRQETRGRVSADESGITVSRYSSMRVRARAESRNLPM